MKMYWESIRIAPVILNLSTRSRWLVTSCPGCFTRREWSYYPLDTRVGGPQSWSGCSGKDKKNPFPALARNWTLVIQPI